MNPQGSHLSDRDWKSISRVLREERVRWRWDRGKEGGGQGRKTFSRYLPLPPPSHSSSYLQWSQSWLNFRCWPRSPICAWWARSDHTLNWNAGPCRPETVDITTYSVAIYINMCVWTFLNCAKWQKSNICCLPCKPQSHPSYSSNS